LLVESVAFDSDDISLSRFGFIGILECDIGAYVQAASLELCCYLLLHEVTGLVDRGHDFVGTWLSCHSVPFLWRDPRLGCDACLCHRIARASGRDGVFPHLGTLQSRPSTSHAKKRHILGVCMIGRFWGQRGVLGTSAMVAVAVALRPAHVLAQCIFGRA